MQFSVRLSFFLLGFAFIAVLPHTAKGQVSSPRRFRVKVLGQDKLEVSWKEPKGDFEGYKVIYITRPGCHVVCPVGIQRMWRYQTKTVQLTECSTYESGAVPTSFQVDQIPFNTTHHTQQEFLIRLSVDSSQ